MKTNASRFAGIIVVLAATVVLAACGALKLGYKTLPEVAYWWLDGYVDFSDDQAPQVRTELARLHAWHRQQELPRLVEMLERMEKLAPGPVSAQQACQFIAEGQARLNVVADRAQAPVVALALSLEPEQLAQLQRKYRDNNDKFRREWIHQPLAQQREKRYEDALKRYEMIYGDLDGPQKRVLRQGIEHSIYEPQRVLAERMRRQQDLLQVLARVRELDAAPAEAQALLRGYLERAQRSPDASHRAYQEELRQEHCRIFSAVHDSTTPAQRERAVRRLQAYQRDLRELADPR